MNIVLFGPPGAGKGTQSALLVEKLGMGHISTGELLRSAVAKQSELGLKAKSYMESGRLVPDEVVIGLVEEELQRFGSKPFILDGFPRNVLQAETLAKMLVAKGKVIDKAVFLEVPSSVLMRRLTGRRVCEKCQTVYHVDSKPSKVSGICDACGGSVVQRRDDQDSVIMNRLETYEKSTSPLKDFFHAAGTFVRIEGTGSAEEVFSRIRNSID